MGSRRQTEWHDRWRRWRESGSENCRRPKLPYSETAVLRNCRTPRLRDYRRPRLPNSENCQGPMQKRQRRHERAGISLLTPFFFFVVPSEFGSIRSSAVFGVRKFRGLGVWQFRTLAVSESGSFGARQFSACLFRVQREFSRQRMHVFLHRRRHVLVLRSREHPVNEPRNPRHLPFSHPSRRHG